jgi:3-hydroxybutyrate dehydrogenase
MLATLLTAPFLLTKYVWPYMKAQRWGRIIYFNSIHGLVASDSKVAYISAKHGLSGLTKAAAVEGGRYGITVNSICPAYVWSPGTEQQIGDVAQRLGISRQEALEDNLLQKAGIKTLVRPQEVVDTFCFLCSDAADHITGSLLTMDGGYTAS